MRIPKTTPAALKAKKNLTWVIERYKGDIHCNHAQVAEIAAAAKELGYKVHIFEGAKSVKQEHKIMEMLVRKYNNVPTVFSGCIYTANEYNALVASVPGSYLKDYSPFCSVYYPIFEKEVLNNDYRIIRAGKLWKFLSYYDTHEFPMDGLFCKPDTQNKFFLPRVFFKQVRQIFIEAVAKECEPEDIILLTSAKKPFKEYRMLYVDGRIPTGSQYRQNGYKCVNPADPEKDKEVFEFAKYIGDKACAVKNDPPIISNGVSFIDIAWWEGKLKLVEFSPFSCAGFYACDVPTIVRSVSESALALSAKHNPQPLSPST
jgi:hypothetical protein